MLDVGLYIHIPFCAAKCNYCDFLSFSDMDHIYAQYVTYLINEIQDSRVKNVNSVYIGGGTPTVLPPNLMQEILNCVSSLPMSCNTEITVEINPGTVSKEYLELLMSNGINRLSFGLQSTCNNTLASIGRIHTYEQFLENYFTARDIGFANINVDMIFTLPSQTISSFENSLSKVVSLEPQHISFYSLTPCENTPLWDDLCHSRISLPSDIEDRAMYHFAAKLLSDSGYLHYEISNAAKPGFECAHNINCWLHKPYLGFGLGAHSFDGQSRWSNPSTFSDYFSRLKPDFEILSNEELISEAMILGLRMLEGVDELLFMSRYGVKPSLFFGEQIRKLVAEGLLECKNDRIRLTSLGLDLANRVFVQFLHGE